MCLLVCLFWLTAHSLKTHRYLAPLPSPEIVDRNNVPLYKFLNARDEWCEVRTLATLGPRIIDATLAVEDNHFRSHFGVDPQSVLRAAWQNISHGRIVSGASTITMQVIKLGEENPHDFCYKLLQAWNALRLEHCVTKDEILAAYLNRAPYGLNLIGVESAARRYFGRPTHELTIAEAALLAGLPKAPSLLMPLSNPEKAMQRRNYVLERMWRTNRISLETYRTALNEPLGVSWHPFPSEAPHVAMRLREQATSCSTLRTTMDATIQAEVERHVARTLRRYGPHITNAAVIVIDTQTAQVRAWVGSGNFMGTRGGGQVDACRATRSPGSALKPFTYALAIERNVLFSSEMMLDDTLDYGSYSPENFDNGYNGLVSATDALRHSLNVPAVMTLDRIGVENLHTTLCELGFTTLTRTPQTYGLGLTLGDCEVRLDELVAAYATLANLGTYRPLTLVTDTTSNGSIPITKPCLSRGTCAALYAMLEQPLPTEWNDNLVKAQNPLARVCWKTGTSTGYHDAWAVLFNRQYTVGVWLGNNDGRSAPELIGLRSALPLATRIFRMLPPGNFPEWPNLQDDLRAVSICAVSGLPASEWCLRTKNVLLPTTQYFNRICDVHYPMNNWIAEKSSKRSRERWPGTARSWDLAKVSRPAEGSNPTAAVRGESLRIQDPVEGAQYVLSGEQNGDKICLRASVETQTPLFWYLDGVFLGKSTPDMPVIMRLESGNHNLACMASSGAIDKVAFNVEAPYVQTKLKTP